MPSAWLNRPRKAVHAVSHSCGDVRPTKHNSFVFQTRSFWWSWVFFISCLSHWSYIMALCGGNSNSSSGSSSSNSNNNHHHDTSNTSAAVSGDRLHDFFRPDMPNALCGLPKSHHARCLPAQPFQSHGSCQTGAKGFFPAWENSLGSFLLPWIFIVEARCASPQAWSCCQKQAQAT